MSEAPGDQARVDDDQLPDDLVPADDNPLAEPLPDGESAGDLLDEGKSAAESEGSDTSHED